VSPVPPAGLRLRRYGALLGRYLRPQARKVALLALLVLGGIGLQLVQPQILRYFIETAQSGGRQVALLWAAAAFLGFALARHLASLGSDFLAADTGWTATNALRADLAEHVLRLEMPFHKAHSPGELIERIDGDVTALSNFFSVFSLRLLGSGLLVAGILGLLYGEDWRVGTGLTAYALLTLAALGLVQRAAVPRWAAQRQADAELMGFIEERIAGREEIQAAGAQAYTLRRLYELLRGVLLRTRAALVVSHVTQALGGSLSALGYAVGLALGVLLYTQGKATLGTAYLVAYYIGMLAEPLQSIREQVQDLQRATASVDRVAELMDLRPQVADPAAPEALPAGPLPVEFEEVTFRYEEAAPPSVPPAAAEAREEVPALQGVSFSLKAGQVLGLLGRTGSGKTTLARLVYRLYDPQQGAVRLAGVDVRRAALAEVRGRVGVVTQEVQLFQASLRENLTFFDPAICDEQIEGALRALRLWDWVCSLPRGLDTPLSAGGYGLSAGEAQLLSFARVFLQDPGVVILDEASSRLDPVTETLLERAVDRLLEGRTGIVIAHRLRTVQRASDLLILENGRAVEMGARATLAADPRSRFSRLLHAGLEEALQ